MAYLQFEHIQSASTGIVAGKPQPALGAFERDIVRMSLQDGRSSLADIGRLVRIGMWLGGVRRKGGLANPRLEALRRYAILYRLNGQGLEASEELAMDRAGFDARGFIFAAAAACQLDAAFVPVRKKGKLPHKTIEENFSLEYGEDTVAIHEDALKPGARVLLLDDLLATGGTAAAAAKLVSKVGAEIVEIGFLIELDFLKGREKLGDYPIHSVVTY